jgi:hypothetical protein
VVFGTMDKQHRVSAGNVGFKDPREEMRGDPDAVIPREDEVYDKLYQVPWDEGMRQYGYDGTHLTIGAKDFIAAFVAPLIRASRWDGKLIDAVARHQTAPGGTVG